MCSGPVGEGAKRPAEAGSIESMQFDPPLRRARLVRRYKRFLADVVTESGDAITLHCPNTGAMTGCAEPGSDVWYSWSDNPKRKYPGTMELVGNAHGRIGVNSARANTLIAEAIQQQRLVPFSQYVEVKREVASPDQQGRFDLLLSGPDLPDCYVEVKSMTLLHEPADGLGCFPDAVSARATKHVQSLLDARRRGFGAALVFCAQHTGVERATVAQHIDPRYAASVAEAVSEGVEVYAFGCAVDAAEITVTHQLPFALPKPT